MTGAIRDNIRVLYAEDNRTDGDLTRALFEAEAPDLTLDIATTGSDCLARLAEGRHDVLLLDNHLPDMDAADVIKAMASAGSTVPVVVVTTAGDEELVVRLLRLGARDYVPKHDHYIQHLPAALRAAVAEQHRRRQEGHDEWPRPRRVLYIERHPADIDLTTAHLAEQAPHLTLEAVRTTGAALDRLAAGDACDLVLTDLRMPDMHALDLLRELRIRGQAVPVIVVTGQGDETAAVAALNLGAYDYIVKREGYLTQLPYAIDHAIDRFQLERTNRRLDQELAERARLETERAQLAEQLRQSQKIDALGRLAGGVAHDFNNLLTVIVGHADIGLDQIRAGDPLREDLSSIKAAGMRAADLTRQLLAFSRQQMLQPRVIDLNLLIGESTRILNRLLGEDVELVTVLAPDLGRVRADPGQIDQVIINLAVNARDAMPRGGRLTIETVNVAIGEQDAQRHESFEAGSYILLAISDTGHAIDPTIMPLIFEPFFTTKEQGHGTGLGLSMVYGIVKQSGGWIWVYSEPGHGTTFKIYLPRVDEPVTAATEPAEAAAARGHETVLVVEDDEAVRKLTCQALRKYGYQVLEAANGGEALLYCERRREPIPLMITDVVMPQMSGPELAARLRQMQPEMKVIYTSGYTDDAVVRHGLLQQSMAFLQKPFSPTVLARKVREVLDERP